MKRSTLAALSLLSLPLLVAGAVPASAAIHAAARATSATASTRYIDEPFCESNKSTCVDAGLNDWPGTNRNPVLDRALHPTPVLFSSPLTRGRNYSTIAFETDLPAIEVQGAQASPPFCDPVSGDNCVNPPASAQFYPFFSTTFRQGGCTWQEGGPFLPGMVNNFGGSSAAEFGSLLATLYPEPGFTTAMLNRDFNSGNIRNPCRAEQG